MVSPEPEAKALVSPEPEAKALVSPEPVVVALVSPEMELEGVGPLELWVGEVVSHERVVRVLISVELVVRMSYIPRRGLVEVSIETCLYSAAFATILSPSTSYVLLRERFVALRRLPRFEVVEARFFAGSALDLSGSRTFHRK